MDLKLLSALNAARQARKAAAELQAQSGVKLIPIKAKRDQRNRA